MTFWTGAIIGAIGSAVWQLVSLNDFRTKQKCWPWHHDKLGITVPSFIFSVCVKLICAFLVTGFAIHTQQINGPGAAVITGMVADNIVAATANRAKRGYMK